MSSRRRICPECRREIAVVAGRFARHDPPEPRVRAALVSCPGSRARAPVAGPWEDVEAFAVPVFSGQLPLF